MTTSIQSDQDEVRKKRDSNKITTDATGSSLKLCATPPHRSTSARRHPAAAGHGDPPAASRYPSVAIPSTTPYLSSGSTPPDDVPPSISIIYPDFATFWDPDVEGFSAYAIFCSLISQDPPRRDCFNLYIPSFSALFRDQIRKSSRPRRDPDRIPGPP